MPRDPLDQIYGLIAAGRYTDAIHCVNKILRKQPNYQIAKVWKCEALHGLGSIIESEDLMNSIIEEKPTDKRTIDSIAEYYKGRGNYSKLVDLYENALKYDPSDEEWRKALFESCGLAGDYKKQHIQALNLYKSSSRILFYGMAVVCLLQQDSPVALAIAERMINKQPEADTLKNKNDVILIIKVLQLKEKYEEALKLLMLHEKELDSIVCTFDKRIELLKKLERWEEIIDLLKKYLEDNPNSWVHYETYLETVQILSLQLKSSEGINDPERKLFNDCLKFLNGLQDTHPSMRGPFLALLKFTSMTKRDGKYDDLLTLISKYFLKFGDKSICVFDLKSHLELFPIESAADAIKTISGVSFSKTDLKVTQPTLGYAKHVSFLQMSKVIGLYGNISIDDLEVHCNDLHSCYQAAMDCERKGEYLVLLAQNRFKLFSMTGHAKHLASAIIDLETCIENSPAPFAIHVLLLQLYFALGASKSARKFYEQLRIQSVQVDTLSHLMLTNIVSTGQFSVAVEMWETALKILQHCTSESLEALVWCYRSGLYHRVEEFTNCARRFQKTLTVPLLRVEKVYLDVVMAEPGRAEQLLARTHNRVDWDHCIDNRDFSALPTWDHPSLIIPPEVSYRELVLYCKLREVTLFFASAAISYAKKREEELEKKYRSSFDEVQSMYSEVQTFVGELRQQPNLTSVTRLTSVVQLPLPSVIYKIIEGDAASTEKVCATIDQSTQDSIERVNEKRNCNPRYCLENIVNQIEFLAITTSVFVATRSNQPPSQRRRSEQIIRVLESSWNNIESALVTLPEMSVFTNIALETKLKENYLSAVEDIKKAVRKKLTYLHKRVN